MRLRVRELQDLVLNGPAVARPKRRDHLTIHRVLGERGCHDFAHLGPRRPSLFCPRSAPKSTVRPSTRGGAPVLNRAARSPRTAALRDSFRRAAYLLPGHRIHGEAILTHRHDVD